jgi:hypothetical protein
MRNNARAGPLDVIRQENREPVLFTIAGIVATEALHIPAL